MVASTVPDMRPHDALTTCQEEGERTRLEVMSQELQEAQVYATLGVCDTSGFLSNPALLRAILLTPEGTSQASPSYRVVAAAMTVGYLSRSDATVKVLANVFPGPPAALCALVKSIVAGALSHMLSPVPAAQTFLSQPLQMSAA